MAVARGKYICQSQSLNIHLSDPNYSKLTSMHFYAWKSGLKTGMYYLRSRPAVDAIKFTLNVEELLKASEHNDTEEILRAINKIEHIDDNLKKKDSTADVIELSYKDSNKKEVKEEEEGCISCSG